MKEEGIVSMYMFHFKQWMEFILCACLGMSAGKILEQLDDKTDL